jgi:uncharacterized protein with beta-barrel porin domain
MAIACSSSSFTDGFRRSKHSWALHAKVASPTRTCTIFDAEGDDVFSEGKPIVFVFRQSDKINATGTATLTGGAVQVLAQSGTYARQTQYTILTASAGVTGKFTGVTSNLAFLTALLSYDPKDVFLTLVRNDVTFASVAQTPNQRAVALALDRSAPLSPVVPENSIRRDSRGEAESAHHPMRCLRSSTCLQRL